MTPEQNEALQIARGLATIGIPVFVAGPDSLSSTGFRLPSNWHQTRPDPSVVDAWQPGMALAVVMGQGLDLIDVDPRSGGDPAALNGHAPESYGAALTPSGGVHSFIRSIGVRSRDSVLPGIDVKAGDSSGRGRGFAFIAPTVRVSKVTGQPTAYRWASPPDFTRLVATLRGERADDSGRYLFNLIGQARAGTAEPGDVPYAGPPFDELSNELRRSVTQWVAAALEGMQRELSATASWAEGQTDDRGRGWEKVQADVALRLGRLARATWNDLELADAEALFLEYAPTDGTWNEEDVMTKWRTQSGRGEPLRWPNLRSPSDRDAAGWEAMGLNPTPEPQAPPEGGETVASLSGEAVAARYFGPGGIQIATLAGDVMGLGPLRVGRDDVMWTYASGVWHSDKNVVRDRVARLLGERYRGDFARNADAVVRSYSDTITCGPVAQFINFRNGLLDWRAGELQPHSPEVPSTVQLAVDYDPAGECPAFDRFLGQVVPDDMIQTVWELIGYLMYSGNPLHRAVMLTGKGRNGKGTFLRVISALLGTRNLTNVGLHDLVNTRFATASLFGKLANIAGDIDASYLENTAVFKAITGGDTISAEHKGRDRFDFTPWAVPVFSANKIPGSADTTEGYLARWLIVPFPHSFTGREDRHLDAKLQTPAELRGIAARGVAALPQLLTRGNFPETASSKVAQEEFERRVDQVRTWMADCCRVDPQLPFVPRTQLYEVYKNWASRDGHRPVRASEFYERLEGAGITPATVRGTRGFKGMTVVDDGRWHHLGAFSTAPNEGAGYLPVAPSAVQVKAPGAPATVPAPSPAPKESSL